MYQPCPQRFTETTVSIPMPPMITFIELKNALISKR
jgi:hypothetical protein